MATATATTSKAPAAKRRTRKAKSDLQGRFEGLVKLVNEQKLINQLANKLNLNATKAKQKLYAVITRVGRSEGLVSKRSQTDVELVLTTVLELKPSVAEFVEELKSNITYRSNKTGKRDSSWIRDLMAGVPRLEEGVYKAYVEISEAKATEICEKMGIDLPTSEEEAGEPEVEAVTE
jgi:hypothetical protein